MEGSSVVIDNHGHIGVEGYGPEVPRAEVTTAVHRTRVDFLVRTAWGVTRRKK